jgi:2,5-furandicarboxylate decarboxylase 1
VVVDDDIDVFNGEQVEWAIATRVQGDRDLIIIPGARAKPLDPSLPVMPPGMVPTGAKVGVDATISEGIPHERYERISYAYADTAKIDDYVAGKADPVQVSQPEQLEEVAQKILALIGDAPLYYTALAEQLSQYDFQTIARALGVLHERDQLWKTPEGKLCVRGSRFDAIPPMRR